MSYENTAGERIEHEMLHDWSARVFQHELDHLNGIVFTDRVLREVRLVRRRNIVDRRTQHPANTQPNNPSIDLLLDDQVDDRIC